MEGEWRLKVVIEEREKSPGEGGVMCGVGGHGTGKVNGGEAKEEIKGEVTWKHTEGCGGER